MAKGTKAQASYHDTSGHPTARITAGLDPEEQGGRAEAMGVRRSQGRLGLMLVGYTLFSLSVCFVPFFSTNCR